MRLIKTSIVTGLACLNSILPGTLANAQSPTMIIDPRSFGLSAARFSARLAIAGDKVAVGQATTSRSVYIFQINSNAITKLSTITPPDTVYDYNGDGWPTSLGLAGDVFYAGCLFTWRTAPHDGTAYLFKNLNGSPILVSKWTELPSQRAGYFGACGRLVGDTLVVSQGTYPENGSKGGAFFYRVDTNGNRTSVFSFMTPDADRGVDGLGLSGNLCAVLWSSRANSNNCQVLVFDIQRDAMGAFVGVATNAVIAATGYSGAHVLGIDCDADLVAVGEPAFRVDTNVCGRVRVWRAGGGGAALIGTLTPPDLYSGGNFGECICLKDNVLLVGSPTVPGISNAQGCVYVYNIPASGEPVLIKTLQPGTPVIGNGEYFGNPIAWDKDRIIIGSSGGIERAGSGAVYVYTASVVVPQPCISHAATGTAILAGSFVVGVNITDGGCGYTNAPLVRFFGGGGSGAEAVAVISNSVVTAVTVLDAGFGYTSAPVVVIAPPSIPNPVLSIAPMTFLAFSNLTVGGVYQLQRSVAWYWSNQPVSFTATNALHTQIVPGVASSGDYRLALSPVPAQAFATAQVVNGFVVGATVTGGGSGYVTSPVVSIVGGGGTNATAVSHISGGVVTSITITSAGIGYTNTPTVQIAQPPAAAVTPTVLPMMRLDSASLSPYDNYQIQFKADISGTWGNWNGGLFSPTDATNSQHLFITNGTGFFRLQYVP